MQGDSSDAMPSSCQKNGLRMYRICLFKPGAVVPSVELFSAHGDEQAIEFASSIDPSAEREVWDLHRLVAQLPAGRGGAVPAIDTSDGCAVTE